MVAAALAVAPTHGNAQEIGEVLQPQAPSFSDEQCGSPDLVADTVQCPPSGNTYPTGVDYDGIDDLTIVVQEDVVIQPTDGGPGVVNSGDGAQTVTTDPTVQITTTGSDGANTYYGSHGIMVDAVGTAHVDNGATIATSGLAAAGIAAFSSDGNTLVVNTGTIATSGNSVEYEGTVYSSHGIYGTSNSAPVEIRNYGAISTGGSASGGIVGVSQTGDVTISNHASITTTGDALVYDGMVYGAPGIAAQTSSGEIDITNSGAITTQGEASDGIFAYSDDGLISITSSGNIATSGDNAQGIYASSLEGPMAITSEGDITTEGEDAWGIYAETPSGSIIIDNSGDITTDGADAGGIAADSSDGAIEIVTSGDITTNGTRAYGIWAGTYDGAISITNTGEGSITTHGGGFAPGMFATTGSGQISLINEGDITTHGETAVGIDATSFYGGISITNSGDITTSGIDADGIFAETNGGIDITNSGTIVASGASADGIIGIGLLLLDDGEPVTINNSGEISAGDDGIYGLGTAVTVDNSGDIAAGVGDGIEARSFAITVVNSGTISAGEDGIRACAIGPETVGGEDPIGPIERDLDCADADTINILNQGDIGSSGTPVGGTGILAQGADTTIDNSGAIYSTGTGIHAEGDLISISNAGTIETLGDEADGIAARGGAITITSAGMIATEGDDAQGIDALTTVGPISIGNPGDIDTTGLESHGILAVKDGGGEPVANDIDVASSGDIATTGLGASGIVVSNDLGNFDVTVSGAVTTGGDDAPGVDASTADGSGSVNTVAGVISTSGDNSAGVLAYANGTLDVDVGTVTTTGDNSPGVEAFDPISDVTVTALDVTTFGDYSTGILAGSEVADVSVMVEDVTTHGLHAPGVHAFTGSGDVTVSVLGDVAAGGPGSSGVIVNTPDGLQSVFVDSGGSITSGPDGSTPAAVLFEGTGLSELVNHGLIQAANDLVVSSVSSIGTTIDNLGTMIGNVLLGDAPDTIRNHEGGLFRARGDSFFGGGFDQFINAGTTQVVDGPVTFHDLELFDNSNSTITMVDGDPNDSLTLPGEYVGGGLLEVDALIGPDGDSDQLILQGIVSGDPTAVTVNIIDVTGPSTEGISVVTLENGTSGDQFFLADGPIDAGLFQLDLFGGGDEFRLVSIPDEGNIGSPMATLPALVALTHEVTGKIDRNNEILEGEGEEALEGEEAVPAVAQVHAGSWAKIVGSSVKQDTETSFTLGDTRVRQSDRFDLGLVGIIGGLDIAQSGVHDGTKYAWLVGALGGYVWADVDFDTATGTQDIESAVVGGYGGLAYGGFRMHLLGKMDFGDVTFNEPDLAPGLAAQDKADFRTVSVESNLGYKFQLPSSMYVQPIASLYYSHTELKTVTIGGTTVAFEDLDSLRARAGLRLGANIVGEKYVLDPWVQASIWHELLDSDTQVTLGSGGTSLDLIGAGVETYGEVGAGVNVVHIGPGLSGQVRADAKFGDLDLMALSGQVGIEYRFPVD